MHYYLLGFGYCATDYEDTENFNSDFELGHDSYYLIAAEQYVKKLAESHKVDLRHAYSWPDGSLFKYLRSERPLSSWELRDWFRGDEPHTYQTSETKYQVSVYLSSVVEVDGNTVHLTEYLSLAERWALSREEAHKLYRSGGPQIGPHEVRRLTGSRFHRFPNAEDPNPECPARRPAPVPKLGGIARGGWGP